MERYVADIRTLLTLYGDPLAPTPQSVFHASEVVIQEMPL
jgi:hypothetical protein